MQHLKSLVLAGMFGLVAFFSLVVAMGSNHAQAANDSQVSDEPLLAIYILAFDNDPKKPNDNDPNQWMSLSAYYTPTVQGIVDGTSGLFTKTAVILADLDGGLDTHILIAENGVLTPIDGLPEMLKDGSIQLSDTIEELDVADGHVLGTFLRWAREQYPDRATVLSYLGHGESIVPKVNFMPTPDMQPVADTPTPEPTPDTGVSEDNFVEREPIAPLPIRWRAHQGFTDFHSASWLSIYDLGLALSMATNDGADPFKTVDLVQCFSSSIEQLYELHPYAETVVGAPNYTYSKPDMVGAALAAIDPAMTAVETAQTILATYDTELPVDGHPRLLVGVENSKIPAVKAAWDKTSFHLGQALAASRDATKSRIQTAYAQSAKYDTTLCDQVDFALAPPDAMSDMSDFATQLSSVFGQTSPVGSWALTTTMQIDEAIIARHSHGGVPWFAEGANPPEWSLHGPGISLFTDFSADSSDGLSWQAYWYSDTVSSRVPQPFQFLQNSADSTSWADIFADYWDYAGIGSGQVPTTEDPTQADCKPAFLASRGPGELAATDLTVALIDGADVSAASTLVLRADLTFSMTVSLQSQKEAVNPQVLFNIYRNGRRIMSEVETPEYVKEGSVIQIPLEHYWLAKYPGLYEFEVFVDSDDRFTETNEEDNTVRTAINVIEPPKLLIPFIVQ